MKKIFNSRMFRTSGLWVIHPLLFAIFPVLFMYSANILETKIDQVYLPLGVSLGGALVLLFILTLIMRSLVKAGLATTLFIILFFAYGRIYDALEQWGVFVPPHYYFLPATIFVWGYCVYFFVKAKRNFKNTTRILNYVAAVLIIVNLVSIGWYAVKNVNSGAHETAANSSTATQQSGRPQPDIYYIILDGYMNPDSIQNEFQYDNSEFINNLESKGFFWAKNSQTRFSHTLHSLTASLNMEYVDEKESADSLLTKFTYNKVEQFLRSQGYQYVHVGNHWGFNYSSPDADVDVNFYEADSINVSSTGYLAVLINTSMLKPFYNTLFDKQNQSYYRQGILDTLEYLKIVPELEGPKFTFAHLICPHAPNVFGPRGEFIDLLYWYTSDKQYYLGQYVFITNEIQRVVDSILEKSDEPPIIIIQSDHGYYENWQKILNVYYLPGMDKAILPDSISPVNSFRLIFNYYFGADYALLEN